jgi:ribonuclease VapC
VILDTWALLAIVFREPGFEDLLERIQRAPAVAAGTPTLAETGIVLHARLGERSRGLLERLLDELGVQEIPFGEVHWREAVEAYRRYGKGRHPAGLNFGDCLTYATARLTGEPLLFTGADFAGTDLERA